MKQFPFLKTLNIFFAAALSIGFSLATPAAAQEYLIDLNSKKVTDLGTLGERQVTGINDAGQIVGAGPVTGSKPPHAFVTGPDGVGLTELGTLGGRYSFGVGINNAGQVVGFSDTKPPRQQHAFITGANGTGMTDLGTLGGSRSSADGVNDAGQVVGSSETSTGSSHAFITGPNGAGMKDLGTIGETDSEAYAINNAGQVAGWFGTWEQERQQGHAFITGPNGVGMQDLGTLPGNSNAYAIAINSTGQVAGSSEKITTSQISGAQTITTSTHAFITGPDGADMKDLGTLGGSDSFAYGMNDAGQVVGASETGAGSTLGPTHAFITGPNGVGMTDLNSLLELPEGTILFRADGINNHGQIIASGTTSLVPEPQSYALMLAGLALVGLMLRREYHVA